MRKPREGPRLGPEHNLRFSLPTARAAISLTFAANCSPSRMLQPQKQAPFLQLSTATSRSARIAAVSCGVSMSCREPPTNNSHSGAIRRDHSFAVPHASHPLHDGRPRRHRRPRHTRFRLATLSQLDSAPIPAQKDHPQDRALWQIPPACRPHPRLQCKRIGRIGPTIPIGPTPRGFVQSGFCEVAPTPERPAPLLHATSQNPQDSLGV